MEKRKISKKECSRIIRNDCMVIVVLVVLTVFIGVKNTKANEVEPVEAIGEVVTEIPIEEQELEDVPKEPRMISERILRWILHKCLAQRLGLFTIFFNAAVIHHDIAIFI